MLRLQSSPNNIIECDFVISATGVQPNTSQFQIRDGLAMDEEGYFMVNDQFQVIGEEDIFAAGDCCAYHPNNRSTQYFFQMKLWTQVRKLIPFYRLCLFLLGFIHRMHC